MCYKPGDFVIKNTGGNKMSVYDITSDGYKCIWCVDNKVGESIFKENEIVSLDQYRITEERHYKIDQLLK